MLRKIANFLAGLSRSVSHTKSSLGGLDASASLLKPLRKWAQLFGMFAEVSLNAAFFASRA